MIVYNYFMNATSPASLTVVVPAYNEYDSLPNFAPALVEFCLARGWRLVFVNDGSCDGTGEFLEGLAQTPQVCVVHHRLNRGYGGALKTGIRQVETPYLVTIDADGQHQMEDIETVFQFMLAQDADMVVGKRDERQNPDLYRSLGKKLIRTFTRMLMPLPINDLNSGFKLYRTGLAQRYINICPNSMAFSDVITLVFLNERNLVLEHPIRVAARKGGKSTITAYTAFETVVEILNIVLMFNPLRVFLPLAAACILVGAGWGLPIILMGRGVSVGAMLAIVSGLIFFVGGLIASQLSALRLERLQDNIKPPGP